MAKQIENAVLTIRSLLEFEQDKPEWSELNTKAYYRVRNGCARIRYEDLDDTGEVIGITKITVTRLDQEMPMVTVQKEGFSDALLIFEAGKSHPISYQTMLGTFEMQLHAVEVRAECTPKECTITLRYSMNLGDSANNINTVIMHVTMQAPA